MHLNIIVQASECGWYAYQLLSKLLYKNQCPQRVHSTRQASVIFKRVWFSKNSSTENLKHKTTLHVSQLYQVGQLPLIHPKHFIVILMTLLGLTHWCLLQYRHVTFHADYKPPHLPCTTFVLLLQGIGAKMWELQTRRRGIHFHNLSLTIRLFRW